MANMSYCRFQNTLTDFEDCSTSLAEAFEGDLGKLSREELRAAIRLVEEARDLVNMVRDMADVDEDGALTDDAIREVITKANDELDD